jgi:hypothetical protein
MLVAAAIFTRPERTLLTVTAPRRPIRKRAVAARPRRIAIVAARRSIFPVTGVRTPFALRFARKTALGEFLFRTPGTPERPLPPDGRSRRPRESLFLSLSRGMKGLVSGAGTNDDHARSFNEAHSHSSGPILTFASRCGGHFCKC